MSWRGTLLGPILGRLGRVAGLTEAIIGILSAYACARNLTYREWSLLARCAHIVLRSRRAWHVTLAAGPTFDVADQSQYVNVVLLLKSRLQQPCWEPHSSLLIQSLLRPTDRVVVAGANIGFEALLAASRLSGPGSLCYAFEPVRENFALLRENVRLSGLGAAMRLFNVALGRADGTTRMAVAGSRSSSVLPVAGARREDVTVRSLDSLFRECVLEPACAIIADIEGSELDMLLGGEEFIAASPLRFMMLELNRAVEQVQPGTASSVIRLLHGCGFVCFGIDDDYRGFRRPTPATGCLRQIERPEEPFVLPYGWFNVLALPRSEVPALAALGAIATDAT